MAAAAAGGYLAVLLAMLWLVAWTATDEDD